MTQLSCLLIGEETLVIGYGDALIQRGHHVAGVVSGHDEVLAWAHRAGLDHATNADDIVKRTAVGSVDWLLSITGPDPLPDALRNIPRAGTIALHDGPLPGYAGAHTAVWALIDGAARHGITWHLVEGAENRGDILVECPVDIAADETALSLTVKCSAAGLDGFDALLGQLEARRLERTPQDPDRRQYHAPNLRPAAAGRLDFHKKAADIARFVRALDFGDTWNPLTCPKIKAGGRLLLVRNAKAVEVVGHPAPGAVMSVTPASMTVAAKDGAVRLSGFTDLGGRAIELHPDVLNGAELASPTIRETEALRVAVSAMAPTEPLWRARLAAYRPARLALAQPPRGLASWSERRFTTPDGLDETRTLAALAAWALYNTGDWGANLVYASAGVEAAAKVAPGVMNPWVPLSLALDEPAAQPVARLAEALAGDLAAAKHGSFAPDLIARAPELSPVEIPSIGISRKGPIEGTALTLALDGEKITLWYDPRLIEDEVFVLLATRLALFLETLAADADRPVCELLALPAAERNLTIVEWNKTQTESDLGPIHRAFEAQVDRTPDATALVFNDHSLSYAELDARANALAHRLIAEGAKPGDRIGIYLHGAHELMVAAVAIHKAGGVCVPLDPAHPADRLAYCVTNSEATLVVTDEGLLPSLPEADTVPVILSGKGDTNRPQIDIPEDALACVIYTSGSTGTPKGVMVEHRNVSNALAGMDALLAPGGTWLAVSSLGLEMSVLELFYTLTRGVKVVILGEDTRLSLSADATDGTDDGADHSLSAQLLRHKADVLQCTSSMARTILSDAAARAALGSLKQILLGGEGVTASLIAEIRALTDAEIIHISGPIETTIWSMAQRVEGGETGVVPVGKPMANQTVYVLDAEMQPVPVGLPGELWIGGLGVTRGYWRCDDLNADRFRRDPFADENGVSRFEEARIYGTGNLVRWRADGVLEFLGRADRQVRIRDQRPEFGEIEARISRADGVRQAVVVPKGQGDETRLVAYLEPAGDIDIAAVRADLVASLPPLMVPAQFVVLDTLPRTPNRKVDRNALPEPEAAAEIRRSRDGPAPEAGLETRIAAIWEEVLGLDDIRADDNFFALGGDSLGAARVHKEITALEGLGGTAITEIFRYPVLRDIARHLVAQSGLAPPDSPAEAPPASEIVLPPDAAPPAEDVQPDLDRATIMARRREMREACGRVAA
jgi:amino acid adenylation domain-containing protein